MVRTSDLAAAVRRPAPMRGCEPWPSPGSEDSRRTPQNARNPTTTGRAPFPRSACGSRTVCSWRSARRADPVPPALLRTACTDSAVDGPIMEDGTVVDRRKVLAVMDAQQRGPVADHASDGWIEAMLGLRGQFEATPDDLLKSEPEDDLPPMPDTAPGAGAGSSIPLAFNESERAAMAEADALLFRGLTGDMQLSAGQYDPAIDSWVLRPGERLRPRRSPHGCRVRRDRAGSHGHPDQWTGTASAGHQETHRLPWLTGAFTPPLPCGRRGRAGA